MTTLTEEQCREIVIRVRGRESPYYGWREDDFALVQAGAAAAAVVVSEPPCTRNGGHEFPDSGCLHCGWSPENKK